MAATATAMLARMLVDNGKLEEAPMCLQRLAGQWATLSTLDGQTGQQVAATLLDDESLRKWVEEPDSLALRRMRDDETEPPRALEPTSAFSHRVGQQVRGPFPRYHAIVYNQNQNSLVLTNSLGKIDAAGAVGRPEPIHPHQNP